jgi:DsbC/DsbD-like thiol-disulfide interchange protein
MTGLKHILAIAALVVGFANGAAAQSASDVVEIRVLEGWRAADGTHMAALEMRLEPGWKTYWRAPGDAGIPPQFDFRGSRNLKGLEVIWPKPSISVRGGLRTIGYTDVLVLPVRFAPERAGADIAISGRVELGVCRDVCIPVELRVAGVLPNGLTKPDPRIAAAIASRPYSADEAGVRDVRCRMSPIEGGLALRAEVDMPPAGGRELAVIEVADPQIWVAQAKATRQGGTLVAETKLYHNEGRSFLLDRSGVRITVLGQSHAVDIRGCSGR